MHGIELWWSGYHYGKAYKEFTDNTFKFEVIGNVWENPKLLPKGKSKGGDKNVY